MTIRGRWAIAVLILLFVSLGLNFFSAGVFASIRHGGAPMFAKGGVASGAMPEEAVPFLRSALRERRGALRQSGRALGEAARAEPFDADAVRARINDHSRNHDAVRAVFADAIVAALEEMPEDVRQNVRLERFRLDRALRRGVEHRGPGRRGPDGEGPPGPHRGPPPPPN